MEKKLQKLKDPSDFVQTNVPELKDLDSLLRCHICKDFLSIPVLTPCSHSFCSLCIRQYLNVSGNCPLCLNELQESMLRSEFLLGELVNCYTKKVRQKLLDNLMPRNDNTILKSNIIDLDSQSPQYITKKRKTSALVNNNSYPKNGILSMFKTKKEHKFLPGNNLGDINNKDTTPGKSQCPICSVVYPIDYLQTTHIDECLLHPKMKTTIEIIEDDKEEVKVNTILKGNDVTIDKAKSNGPESNVIAVSQNETTPTVETPFLNKYLDSAITTTCLNDQNRKKKLGKLDVLNISTAALKSKLLDLKLPTHGSRQQLINRYNYYELLWNSNYVDSLQPTTEQDLKMKLLNWEKTHNLGVGDGNNNHNAVTMFTNNSNNSIPTQEHSIFSILQNKRGIIDIKSKKFSRKDWAIKNATAYRELIKEAKSSMLTANEKKREAVSELNEERSELKGKHPNPQVNLLCKNNKNDTHQELEHLLSSSEEDE
ncbi:E3 ubiquitin-protein ligase RAD18 SCDLUD_001230 [Saccharomycodes ludwigii]|uniref:E3 ubiquitin-protein ligase RAD18 n=1 Tax=Saccharomycodes ludwigii TaxID=36035 RepID=UPI001E87F3D0|nr:hypothetical protein SCDLUD_001230 [Saccharomycodes ludwigii]KAH3903586.1 hypothetical protein SCDLUD_001230 [Saccharomycodes ludwigii]